MRRRMSEPCLSQADIAELDKLGGAPVLAAHAATGEVPREKRWGFGARRRRTSKSEDATEVRPEDAEKALKLSESRERELWLLSAAERRLVGVLAAYVGAALHRALESEAEHSLLYSTCLLYTSPSPRDS